MFMVLVPILTNVPIVLLLHTVGAFTLLVHWFANNDACSLTLLECTLRGIPKEKALSQRFIGPLYNISDNTWTQVLYVITIGLMCWSLYKLLNDTRCLDAYKSIQELASKPEISQQDLKTRLNMYLYQCRPLFV